MDKDIEEEIIIRREKHYRDMEFLQLYIGSKKYVDNSFRDKE